MRKILKYLLALFVLSSIYTLGVFGQDIKPQGKVIAEDNQGNDIYRVSANGIKIGYKLIGSGKPLLLIMGLGGTMESWPSEVINELSKHYQLIIPDNRGMGYTTDNKNEFTYGLFADDVIALLNLLKIKKTDVLGYSMGSAISQKLLLEYSDRLNKVILYATTTDGSKVSKTIDNEFHDNPVILKQIKAIAKWKTPLNKMSEVNNPVMLIVGTSDKVVGVESSVKLASLIKGAWLIQIKNASHLLIYEAPEYFTKIVLDFLKNEKIVPIDKQKVKVM